MKDPKAHKIIITRGTVAGGQHLQPGAEVEVGAEEARNLIALGKALSLDHPDHKAKVAELRARLTPAPVAGAKANR